MMRVEPVDAIQVQSLGSAGWFIVKPKAGISVWDTRVREPRLIRRLLASTSHIVDCRSFLSTKAAIDSFDK